MPHTPGPWKAERHGACGAFIIDGEHWQDVGIASVNRYDRHDVEANARLIAAAPELLAECERLVKIIKSFPGEPIGGWYWMNTLSRLEAVIAKATEPK
jgi:hypothetical protein